MDRDGDLLSGISVDSEERALSLFRITIQGEIIKLEHVEDYKSFVTSNTCYNRQNKLLRYVPIRFFADFQC